MFDVELYHLPKSAAKLLALVVALGVHLLLMQAFVGVE
jgi:hypothetical protein